VTKTSEEMKTLVEEYIKITNIEYKDQTDNVREKDQRNRMAISCWKKCDNQ